MIDETSVYILNIKSNGGNEIQLISADLYDFMQEQIGVSWNYEIPEKLLAMQKKIPQSIEIEKMVSLKEGTEQVNTWRHIYGCSRDFKTEQDAYKSLGRMFEYAGEIDIYLE